MIGLFILAGVAFAQSTLEMQVEADPSTVGVGDIVHLELSATTPNVMPTDPQPGETGGFVVRGQNSAPAQTHININGSRMDRYTLTTTWALQAQRVGTFHVGPPSIVVGATRHSSHAVTITVVPAGRAPRQGQQPRVPTMPNPFGASPFDLWRGFIPGFDNDNQTQAPAPPATDPKLALDAPRGPFYFLHGTVDKSTVAIGEQVTFSVYEYVDTAAGRVEIDNEDVHDATAADFVKHPLLREDQEPPALGYASVGGRTWVVKLVRRWALFPLHSGDLRIGPMHVRMLLPQAAAGSSRTTETLDIHVTEPPMAGRPPGYAQGDVGHFSLAAQVSPREVVQGSAASVHVELTGTGNIPRVIATPGREGVEWLAPEVHDELGHTEHDAFGGKRTFDFVVRMQRPGQVDLGELALPFWNPDQRKYEVVRAPLGVVRVLPSAAASNAPEEASRQILPGLPPARDVLEGARAPRKYADDSALFWIAGIGAWPFAFGVAVAGRAIGRRMIDFRIHRRGSPARELRRRLAAATSACGDEDARKADAAIARALEAAAVVHAGVSVRGAVGAEMIGVLERAGVTRDSAMDIAELLRECETARFAPESADITAARDRWARAQRIVRALEKGG